MSRIDVPLHGWADLPELLHAEEAENGGSIRRRVVVAFFLLALLCGGIFGGVLYAVYDAVSSRLVQWHMEPVLRMLIASEQDARQFSGPDGAEHDAHFGDKLASAMGVRLYKDADVPLPYRPYTPERYQLTRIAGDHYALSFATDDADLYVIEGRIEDFARYR